MEVKFEGAEKRESVRWYGAVPADAVFFSDVVIPGLPQRNYAIIHNISSLGLCVECRVADALPRDALLLGIIKVGVKFKLPNQNEEMRALGKTVWIRRQLGSEDSSIIGIEFTDVTISVCDALKQHVIDFYLQDQEAA